MFQLSLTPGASPAPLLPAPLSTTGMRLSPDGRAMSYFGAEEPGASGSIVCRTGAGDRPARARCGKSFARELTALESRWSRDLRM